MTNKQTIRAFLMGKTKVGSNPAGSIFFEGNKLYSYGHHFLMAEVTGRDEVTITTRKYSVTTSKQTSLVGAEAAYAGFKILRAEL